ncbi:transcription antitermination factor NusB [Phocicoccus pinnipedialis]|uniref:Transcription antitermination protein NusB n=1 Tax=Phocicoccus pinnipedialis TaxID=110845 RepID=A0A6V7REC3_9BACL|nr:transcription antitermination factor NusB [Jeotgalicoccus pinnipedialis]MBP1939320.1 N utilization substance protein B [Jeotgalicoccus pinnipedialis]CAD2075891.1 Transcription antitermination protein NusB [Jeotgalicoccus pinnipedialis]
MNRHEIRIKAFQILFQLEKDIVTLNEIKFKELLEIEQYLKTIVYYYIEHQEEIDESINSNLTNYTIDRIRKVDRNILRMTIAEMQATDIPKKVAINEAIKIAKIYGESDSYKFINGVLKNY